MANRSPESLCIFLLTAVLLVSCKRSDNLLVDEVNYWHGKTILFPKQSVFTVLERDTVDIIHREYDYKIINYIDSIGCFGCKLYAANWLSFIQECDSLGKVGFLFFFHPDDKTKALWKVTEERFDYPICWDDEDVFNKLNHLPSKMDFQTFLLDKDNKILAIGNPVLNSKVKELYLRIIQGKPLNMAETDKTPQTSVSIPSTEISMGDFPWQEEQTAVFTLKNTGDKPLVIQDAVTSCGCLHVSFTQQPVLPGDEAEVHATYKADNPGYFNKSITVYTNAGDAPMKLRVRGNAVR